jgi:hypothetical protein
LPTVQLDDLNDFDWADDAPAANPAPSSSTKPAPTAAPRIAPSAGPSDPSTNGSMLVDRPSSPLAPETAINGMRGSTPNKLRDNATPAKPSSLPLTSAGSPAQAAGQPPPSPTSLVMARIKTKAEKEAALMSRLNSTRSIESELDFGLDAKGKRKALSSDDDNEFAMDVADDDEDDFGRAGKRGRKQIALSDSDDDALPSLAVPRSSKAYVPSRLKYVQRR